MSNMHNLFSALMAILLTAAMLLMVEFSTAEQAELATAMAELVNRTTAAPMVLS